MGPTNVYAIMAFLIICGMKLLFSLHGSWLRRLLVLLSTTIGCGLQYIHFFLQILSPPLGTPVFSFLKFLLLAICPAEWGLRKWLYRPRPFWWGFGLWRCLIWFEYPISMFSSLKMISFVSCKKALSALASADKHSTPAPKAMLTRAFVANSSLIYCVFQLIKQFPEPLTFLQGGNCCDRQGWPFLLVFPWIRANDDCYHSFSLVIREQVSLNLWLR